MQQLEDENAEVRKSAASTLGRLGNASEPAVQALARQLSNKNWQVRSSAAQALGELGDASEQVIPALVQQLENRDRYAQEYAQASAAQTLGRECVRISHSSTHAASQ